jgi:hypothetical protein
MPIPGMRHPARACEVCRIDALRGFNVCLGIEGKNILGGDLPIDVHGVGIEQLEVSDEMHSIIGCKRVTAGRS